MPTERMASEAGRRAASEFSKPPPHLEYQAHPTESMRIVFLPSEADQMVAASSVFVTGHRRELWHQASVVLLTLSATSTAVPLADLHLRQKQEVGYRTVPSTHKRAKTLPRLMRRTMERTTFRRGHQSLPPSVLLLQGTQSQPPDARLGAHQAQPPDAHSKLAQRNSLPDAGLQAHLAKAPHEAVAEKGRSEIAAILRHAPEKTHRSAS